MKMMMMLTLLMASSSLYLYNQNMYISFPLSFLTPYPISMEMSISWQSSMFISTVMLISLMITKYSKEYIPQKQMYTFTIMLSMFVFSMILLIMSNNTIFLILGWDGLGLTSYILVIFYQNNVSNNAGTLTILTNRVGDIMIIMSITTLSASGLWNISMNKNFPFLVMLTLLMASITKSAQFPFTAWLPAAMAAPTPVSALVHSSTLVTAGIILMMRLSDSIHPSTLKFLLILSLLTSITASLSALWETDLKKMIALSTLSQVAFMMMTISLKMNTLALFHLIVHALFKATMFMCIGQLIHLSNYQDSRSIKSNTSQSPLTLTCLGITSMALSGVPFMSGFYSKDAIIETYSPSSSSTLMIYMIIISITLTTTYNLRITIHSTSMIPHKSPDLFKSCSKDMEKSLIILTPTILISGSTMTWMFMPYSTLIMPMYQKMMPITSMMMASILAMNSKLLNFKMYTTNMLPSSMWMMNMTSSLPMKLLFPGYLFTNLDNSWKENISLMLTNSLSLKSLHLMYKPTLLIAMITITLPIMIFPNSLLMKQFTENKFTSSIMKKWREFTNKPSS